MFHQLRILSQTFCGSLGEFRECGNATHFILFGHGSITLQFTQFNRALCVVLYFKICPELIPASRFHILCYTSMQKPIFQILY